MVLTTKCCRAPPSAAVFVALIVKVPVVQAFAMTLGMVIIALELRLPMLKKYSWHRSFVVRIILLVFQILLTVLFYQVSHNQSSLSSAIDNSPLGNECCIIFSHCSDILLPCCCTWGNREGSSGKPW